MGGVVSGQWVCSARIKILELEMLHGLGNIRKLCEISLFIRITFYNISEFK